MRVSPARKLLIQCEITPRSRRRHYTKRHVGGKPFARPEMAASDDLRTPASIRLCGPAARSDAPRRLAASARRRRASISAMAFRCGACYAGADAGASQKTAFRKTDEFFAAKFQHPRRPGDRRLAR